MAGVNAAMHRLRSFFRSKRPPAQDEPRPAHIDPRDLEIIERCTPYTLTSVPRVQALLDAVDYCIHRDVPGAFTECGVWRGGSVLAMLLKLQDLGAVDRDIYLYDTFDGMTEPSERDTSRYSPPALRTWAADVATGKRAWSHWFSPETFNEDIVRDLLLSTGYPESRIHFVKGPVEQTLPSQAPAELSLLRLDTDWYDSTRHELVHLYPRLSIGGVLIIDDYGHWEGCRQAVDEYFSEEAAPVLLNRIDYTGRIGVKL
jgi:O-methyltransferase